MSLRLDQLAQKALDLQGYLILADPMPPHAQPGDVLQHLSGDNEKIDAPLLVIGSATYEEFQAQAELIGTWARPGDTGEYVKVIAE